MIQASIKNQIPFHKPYITDDEINEVVDSLRSGWLTMGPKTIRFEEEFSRYIGSKYSIAVNSCTAALHLALKAINLKQGEGVVIPSMTFTATGEVVSYFNALPIIVDIDRETMNIDTEKIEEMLVRSKELGVSSKRIKAAIPVHFGGQPCDMAEIQQLAKKYGFKVVEDAAHALPAWYYGQKSEVRSQKTEDRYQKSEDRSQGNKIGTIGDITCFSFYATKTLSTGEGGMITTENEEWAERMKRLRLHGISNNAWNRYTDEGSWYYEVVEAGYKYNMTDIQAALGLAQLEKCEWMRNRRREISERYTQAFQLIEEIITPSIKHDRESAWHLYVIKLNVEAIKISRNEFIEELKDRGIGTSVHFIPLYRHPFYRDTFGYNPEDFPNSEWLYERIISLPIHPGMTDEEVDYVVDAVCDVMKNNRR